MSGAEFVKLFQCDCGQSYRLEVSAIGFRRVGFCGREDHRAWIRSGGRGIESGPRVTPIDCTAVRHQNSDGDGDVVHYGPPPQERPAEDGMGRAHHGHYTTVSSSVPKRQHGSVTVAFMLLYSLADRMKEMLDIIKEGWNDGPRNNEGR